MTLLFLAATLFNPAMAQDETVSAPGGPPPGPGAPPAFGGQAPTPSGPPPGPGAPPLPGRLAGQ